GRLSRMPHRNVTCFSAWGGHPSDAQIRITGCVRQTENRYSINRGLATTYESAALGVFADAASLADIMDMKTIKLGFILLLGVAASAGAVEKAELDSRIRMLTAKLEDLQQKPNKAIPADNLRKAQGIVLLDRTKAGFIFAYQGGSGVALVRDPKTQQWG